MNFEIQDTYLILLCGGKGNRFQKVSSNIPKVLASFGKKCYLDFVVEKCLKYSIGKLILATGHLHMEVEKYINAKNFDLNIVLSREKEPLGTWGAVLNAKKYINHKNFFVMNGDTFNNLNFIDVAKFKKKINSPVIIFGSHIYKNDENEYGLICVDKNNLVLDFFEKSLGKKKITRYKNSGIYLFENSIIDKFKNHNKASLEREILPLLIKKKLVSVYDKEVKFYDFGTLDRFRLFKRKDIENWL